MSESDLRAAIAATGDKIKAIKSEKPPTMKEDLSPLIAELLALKVSFKEVTGTDFDPPKVEKKKDKGAAQQESTREGPSKKELNKIKAKEAKEKAIAAKKAAEGNAGGGGADATATAKVQAGEEDPTLAALYGDSPMIRSHEITEKSYKDICDIPAWADQVIWLRGRLHTSRAVSKGAFLVMRQGLDTIQAIVWQGESCPKAMVKYAQDIPAESIVDLLVTVSRAPEPIASCSCADFELKVKEIHIQSRARELPFVLEDAGRSKADSEATGLPVVHQDTILNYRWVGLRTPANHAIFKIQSAVCQLFREYLYSQRFVEIHTPKLIGGASEGGSDVFKLKYFSNKENACLAQSPQLYKQIACACSGLERVMEVGPVFRAENSNTHRHLCEFTGLDFEMIITEHYYEALDLMGNLFCYIFDGLNSRWSHELKVISQQYPFEPLKYARPTLRITFQEGITLLREAGVDASYDDDIGTADERVLGRIVAEKYDTDFFIMDKYPLSARPFYTMPDPANPKLSNSYDLFIRGQEIVSGAQRIHDPDMLQARATDMGVPIATIQSYIDAFKHGANPHAGGGIGMERVVMLFLGLDDIRKSSMFPRDPTRLSP